MAKTDFVGPQFVFKAQVLRNVIFSSEGEAPRKVSQAHLAGVVHAIALEPIAVEAVNTLFPKVTIAKLAIALHGHGHSIRRNFEPEQSWRLR